jgi:hypothetical protein
MLPSADKLGSDNTGLGAACWPTAGTEIAHAATPAANNDINLRKNTSHPERRHRSCDDLYGKRLL